MAAVYFRSCTVCEFKNVLGELDFNTNCLVADPGWGWGWGVRRFSPPSPGAGEQRFIHVHYERFLPNLDGLCGV